MTENNYPKINVNVISESVLFSEKLGGIYTAFLNNVKLLKSEKSVNVYVNSLKKADITHIHSLGPFAWYKLLTSKNTVITSHWLPESSLGTYKGARLFIGLIKIYLRFFYNQADLVIALNSKTKQDLVKLKVITRIEVLTNPIDTKVFKIDKKLREQGRVEYDIDMSIPVILGAGQLIQRKGIGDFIQIAKMFPEWKFVWAGGSAAIKALNEESSEEMNFFNNPPKNLLLTGNVSYDKMSQLYNLADIFLFPSYQEIAPMAIIEAAACGLPLILRNLPEYKLLYKQSYISCRDVNEFISAIKKLIFDKKMYAIYQQKSSEIAKNFEYSKIANKLLIYYRSLLKPA